MTNIITLSEILRATAEEFLKKEGYTKTFSAEGIGSMWKKGDSVIDITVHEGHSNALISVDPYITVRVDGEPHILHTKEEVEELLTNL